MKTKREKSKKKTKKGRVGETYMIQSRQPRKKQAVSASNAYNEDKKPPLEGRIENGTQ